MSKQQHKENLSQIKDQLSQEFSPGFVGLFVHNKVQILDAHLSLASLFGYDLSELLGKTVLELAPPEVRGSFLQKILLKEAEPYEIIGLKSDGTTFPLELHSKAVPGYKDIRVMAVWAVTNRPKTEVLAALHKVETELALSSKENTTQLRFANEQLRDELEERKRIEAELKTRARQQATVAELGQRALAGTTDLSKLMTETAELTAQTLEVEYAAVMKLDDQYLLLQAGVGWSEGFVGQATVGSQTDSQAGYTLLSGEPVIVEDIATETRFNFSPLLRQHHVVSVISVIIQGQPHPFGVLAAYSSQQRRFTSDNIHFLQSMANVLAMAIERKQAEALIVQHNLENARLFEQTQAALEETAALYRVAQTLARLDNEQEMFELVLVEYLQRLNLQQGGVLIIDDGKKYGTLKAHMVNGQLVEPGLRVPVAGNPSFSRLMVMKEAVIIQDVLHDPIVEPVRNFSLELGIKSLLLVPITVRDEVIGALGADSTGSIHDFTEREVSLVMAMADQLSIAIENIRLYAATQRHAEQLTSLHELDRAITSSLRLSDIYRVFARHAIRLLPHDHLSITLLQEEEMQVAYVTDMEQSEPPLPVGLKLPHKSCAMGWVVERGQPLLRHNIAVDVRFAEDERLVARGIHSMMIVPLRVKGQVIGTWNIGSQQVGAFSPDDLEIPQSMADQLAVAIENARLYHEVHQYLEELTTLNLISQTITSTLDLREMLIIITDRIIQLLNVGATAVALYDEGTGDLYLAAAQGEGSNFVRGKRLVLGQGVVGWVVQHGEPALIQNVAKDPRFFAEFDHLSGFITRSILCVPLQTRGQTIGAIEVMNKEGIFEEDDLRVLSSLATPAAAAIMNAQLYERAQQEIAERKRAEAALQEERALLAQRVAERTADLSAANTELAQAARLKDEFLASMSHELRTPLTAILGLSEVLKVAVYGPLTEKQLKSVRQIEESGRHLLALINDILDLSKIEAGKVELQLGPVSVEAVCQASLQFVKETALKKQLKIFSQYDKKASTVQADERRLKQILVNLLSNAVKFTSEGGQIGLEVRGDEARQLIHFSVWDTGIGIPPEDRGRLFQPFIQLDSSLSRQYAGTGLGLALVHRMVEMHGGSVTLESEGVPGKGSRFIVSLPWPDEITRAIEPVEAAAIDASPPSPSADQFVPLILIAEDELAVSTLLTDFLTDYGYGVVTARNGVEALEQAEAEQPHLILMDVQMPRMDGLEAIRRLRATSRFATVPIIALTALAMPGDRERCLEAGASIYLSKPVNLKEMLKVIQTQLNLTELKKGN